MNIHEKLVTKVVRVTYLPDAHLGVLVMAPDTCCDMTACVKLFEAIDEDVLVIKTYRGDTADITYGKDPNSEMWQVVAEREMKRAFVILETVIDPSENNPDAAYRRVVRAVVLQRSAATLLCKQGGEILGTGWPIKKGRAVPRFTYEHVDLLPNNPTLYDVNRLKGIHP